ncbi:MAG: hypothetical protein ACYDHN_03745 [Solirubrobacteraceae bacterium]
MTKAAPLRRPFSRMAMLALIVLSLSTTASASPTITFKTRALPIPGVPDTGNILGAGAVIQVEYTISGTEYGGFPPPLTGVRFFAPHGAKLHPEGFASCAAATVEQSGPAQCPKRSFAGPQGSASGVVSFGGERVPETLSVQPLFAPDGSLEFYLEGHTPVSVEILSSGHIIDVAAPFSLEVLDEVPLIETVPGALDASTETIDVKVGAAYKRGKHTISYVRVPRSCRPAGLLVKTELSFLGGATAQATYEMPCPRREPAARGT